MGAGAELCRHIRVHGNHHFLFGIHELVPFLDLVIHPLFELLADDHGTNVDNPLLGDARQVDIVGQIIRNAGLVAGELQYFIEGQVLLLGHEQGLDLIGFHERLLPVNQVFHEINGGVI